MKKFIVLSLVALSTLAFSAQAQVGLSIGRRGFSLGLGVPLCCAPAPVVYTAPPVYYAQPACYAAPPVYYAPAPVVYAPAPAYYPAYYGYGPTVAIGFGYRGGHAGYGYYGRGGYAYSRGGWHR